jgi:hypothetical protein
MMLFPLVCCCGNYVDREYAPHIPAKAEIRYGAKAESQFSARERAMFSPGVMLSPGAA